MSSRPAWATLKTNKQTKLRKRGYFKNKFERELISALVF
jgi:hypothetical protein